MDVLCDYRTERMHSSLCHIYEFDPRKIRWDITLGTQNKLEKLSNIHGEPNTDEIPIAKINAGFFSGAKSENIGSFVDKGLYYRGSEVVFPTIIFWKDYKLTHEIAPEQKRHVEYQHNAFWAGSCGWILLKDGKEFHHWTTAEIYKFYNHAAVKNPRTLIGQKSNGNIIWVVVDGRGKNNSSGVNMLQSVDIMQKLGCVSAYNMDGGGSSEMIILDEIKNKPSDGGERSIGSAFITYAPVSLGITGKTTASLLNMRSGPNSSTVISKLVKNTDINIIGYTNGWYKITCKGKTGYVSSQYVEINNTVTRPASNTITEPVINTITNATTSTNIKEDISINTTTSDKFISLDTLKSKGYNRIDF